jgi:GT2 family glycosyltransferase
VVSIVTYNSDKIFRALDALIAVIGQSDRFLVRIFDNHSAAEYQQKLKSYLNYPYVAIHFDTENHGFGYGHNQNLLSVPQHYGIIFNPDIILEQDVMTPLVAKLAEHPECSLLAPKIMSDDGTVQYLNRRRLAVFDYLLRFVPFGFVKALFNKRLARFECRDLSETADSYVRMISGSFMVADLAKFQEVAGFDDRYFMYFEDNDLCMKMEQAGYKLLYTPQIAVMHLYERGAVKSQKLFKIFMRSMKKYFDKWGWQWI